jgi:hypothetical protein
MAKNRLSEEEKQRRIQQEKRELFSAALENPRGSDERVRALVKIASHGWLQEYHDHVAARSKKGEKA